MLFAVRVRPSRQRIRQRRLLAKDENLVDVVRVRRASRHEVSNDLKRMLESRGIRWTDLDGWHRLDEHEQALGSAEERARVKVVPRDEMVSISRGEL